MIYFRVCFVIEDSQAKKDAEDLSDHKNIEESIKWAANLKNSVCALGFDLKSKYRVSCKIVCRLSILMLCYCLHFNTSTHGFSSVNLSLDCDALRNVASAAQAHGRNQPTVAPHPP